jgi:molybdenum transport protein
MIYIAEATLEKILKEDVPYLDLTTSILNVEAVRGRMRFFAREETVLCGTEEAERICSKLGLQVVQSSVSGTKVVAGEYFLEVQGTADRLHIAWRVVLTILEYCSGIATRTRRLVDKARAINPRINILTTRKNFPGAKELSIKAVLAGGGMPHRLGLSETILIFKNHRQFIGDEEDFIKSIPQLKIRACEKKILVETESLEEALRFSQAGVDGVQFDKVSPDDLSRYVPALKAVHPGLLLLAAGGIQENNAAAYARTGVDALVTTAVYFGKPADIGCRMEKIA